ncbi:hypothetical protein N0V88_002043 [Collariella sp. IMI 366227]|nr:hypothetical protein N0V88_002043 [Collariella sp. IMI 366227]
MVLGDALLHKVVDNGNPLDQRAEGRPRDEARDETANGINNEIAVAGREVPAPEVR